MLTNRKKEYRYIEKEELHVTSFELSTVLNEKNVKQDSLNYWIGYIYEGQEYIDEGQEGCNLIWSLNCDIYGSMIVIKKYSAFLATELLELLPPGFILYRSDNGFWVCGEEIEITPGTKIPLVELSRTPANACAKMVLHLIEDKTAMYKGFIKGEKNEKHKKNNNIGISSNSNCFHNSSSN